MQLNKASKETIEKLYIITGLKRLDIRFLFEGLSTLFLFNYHDSKSMELPFFGEMKINEEGNLEIEPNHQIKKIIEQAKNGEETDVEKVLKSRISATLGSYIE